MTRLRELRLKTGKTIKQVSIDVGISANYISEIETGKRPLNPKTLKVFCEYFGVKPNELLEYDDFILIDESSNEFTQQDIEIMRLIKQLTESDKAEIYNFLSYLIYKHQQRIEDIENGKKGNWWLMEL